MRRSVSDGLGLLEDGHWKLLLRPHVSVITARQGLRVFQCSVRRVRPRLLPCHGHLLHESLLILEQLSDVAHLLLGGGRLLLIVRDHLRRGSRSTIVAHDSQVLAHSAARRVLNAGVGGCVHATDTLPASRSILHSSHAALLERVADGLWVEADVLGLAVLITIAALVAHELYVVVQRVNCLMLARRLITLEDVLLLQGHLLEAVGLLLPLLVLVHLQR